MLKLLILIFLCPLFVVAQDSPMQAAPGSAPPPQGWSRESSPNGGIHLPHRVPKKKYQMKMGPVETPSAKPQSPSLTPTK
jgi:hypothetical protein